MGDVPVTKRCEVRMGECNVGVKKQLYVVGSGDAISFACRRLKMRSRRLHAMERGQ